MKTIKMVFPVEDYWLMNQIKETMRACGYILVFSVSHGPQGAEMEFVKKGGE